MNVSLSDLKEKVDENIYIKIIGLKKRLQILKNDDEKIEALLYADMEEIGLKQKDIEILLSYEIKIIKDIFDKGELPRIEGLSKSATKRARKSMSEKAQIKYENKQDQVLLQDMKKRENEVRISGKRETVKGRTGLSIHSKNHVTSKSRKCINIQHK